MKGVNKIEQERIVVLGVRRIFRQKSIENEQADA